MTYEKTIIGISIDVYNCGRKYPEDRPREFIINSLETKRSIIVYFSLLFFIF